MLKQITLSHLLKNILNDEAFIKYATSLNIKIGQDDIIERSECISRYIYLKFNGVDVYSGGYGEDPLTVHTFLKCQDKFFDSENIDGVESAEELKVFQELKGKERGKNDFTLWNSNILPAESIFNKNKHLVH